jgi:hypothetical protein
MPPDPRGDPLAGYNFRVSIGGQSLGFTRVSGLQRAHKTVTYRHGRSFLEGERFAVLPHDEFRGRHARTRDHPQDQDPV